MTIKLTRREMIGTLGALAIPAIIPSRVLGENAPSKKIALGCIGMGGTGY